MGETYEEVLAKLEEAETKVRLAEHFTPEKTFKYTVC